MFFIGVFNNVHAMVNEIAETHTTAVCINRQTWSKQCRLLGFLPAGAKIKTCLGFTNISLVRCVLESPNVVLSPVQHYGGQKAEVWDFYLSVLAASEHFITA